jgi:hypothetical protein
MKDVTGGYGRRAYNLQVSGYKTFQEPPAV